MSAPQKQDFKIYKGKTFLYTLRWETLPFVYKAITAITKAAPAQITAASHGLIEGWRAAVVSAGGMREINAGRTPPSDRDFHKVTVVDPNTVTFNDVNSSGFTAYTSGGYLQYYTPAVLANYTARMQVRATADATGDPLLELTTSNGRIDVDDTNKIITLLITADDTAALTFITGVYDLELVSPLNVVTGLLSGNITVVDEVTR